MLPIGISYYVCLVGEHYAIYGRNICLKVAPHVVLSLLNVILILRLPVSHRFWITYQVNNNKSVLEAGVHSPSCFVSIPVKNGTGDSEDLWHRPMRSIHAILTCRVVLHTRQQAKVRTIVLGRSVGEGAGDTVPIETLRFAEVGDETSGVEAA